MGNILMFIWSLPLAHVASSTVRSGRSCKYSMNGRSWQLHRRELPEMLLEILDMNWQVLGQTNKFESFVILLKAPAAMHRSWLFARFLQIKVLKTLSMVFRKTHNSTSASKFVSESIGSLSMVLLESVLEVKNYLCYRPWVTSKRKGTYKFVKFFNPSKVDRVRWEIWLLVRILQFRNIIF